MATIIKEKTQEKSGSDSILCGNFVKVHANMENYKSVNIKFYMIGGIRMSNELLESETFGIGVATGISLYQNKVVMAHERKEALRIGENLYYVQDGRERLQEEIEKICR